MTDTIGKANQPTDILGEMLRLQTEVTEALLGRMAGLASSPLPPLGMPSELGRWSESIEKMQALWLGFQAGKRAGQDAEPQSSSAPLLEPGRLLAMAEGWYKAIPFANSDTQAKLWADGVQLWESLLGKYGIGEKEDATQPALPFADRRFADPRWREQPVFAAIHQLYLLFSEQIESLVGEVEGLDRDAKEKLRFATRTVIDALSPANFPLTNPVVWEETLQSRGENLVQGMEHLLADLKRGQLTQVDMGAFEVGRNIAATPGKVVYESRLFQLIQYVPVTEQVLAVPLLIFPPWINRFYILDLNPGKSMVRWAVENGLSTFVVSWKSADASMADVGWDDYIRAQMEAMDVVRQRLKVPHVHAVGYCVAGTMLAATLAVMARRGEADKVKSATFFTTQVDFEQAGDLRNFVDDQQLAAIARLAPDGYLDGRYMAATFNLLRGPDLIWNYVVNNYLLGKDYTPFDLLYWNGDTTNLPAKWHLAYLRDLYRDNKLALPDALAGDGTPIDLTRVTVPAYIQAGQEDHIAPPASVWRLTRHLKGPWTFVLAGSGHIAGVINPPAAGKYGYRINPGSPDSLADFIAGAREQAGSWWPHWLEWLRGQDSAMVPATGKRVPGGRGDKVIEDAPGRYVKAP